MSYHHQQANDQFGSRNPNAYGAGGNDYQDSTQGSNWQGQQGQQGYQDSNPQVIGTRYDAATGNQVGSGGYPGNTDSSWQGGNTVDAPGAGVGSGNQGQGDWQSSGGTGAGGYDQDNFDQSGNNSGGNPSMSDRLKGNAEKMAGSVTGNPGMKQRGQERKAGDF